MINPINHYALENHPTIYDEESLTALELVARTTHKLNEVIKEVNGFVGATPEKIKTDVDEWMKAHPEAYTTVMDKSLGSSKFLPGALGYVTPEMFGAVGDGVTDDTQAIKDMFAFGLHNYLFDGHYLLTDNVTVPGNSVLQSNNATFTQDVFGKGIFTTTGSNIRFIGTFNFVQTREKVKLDVEGVECSALLLSGPASNITIDIFNIKSFIGGLVFGGYDHQNIKANRIHVENCDFGVWGANVHTFSLDTLSFKNVDNSQLEPAHALYLTSNDREIKSTDVYIRNVIGTGCIVGDADAVLSIKATSGFYCDNLDVKNVNVAFTAANSSGYIKNPKADGVHNYVFMIQGSSPDGRPFQVLDGDFCNLDCEWYAYGVGAYGFGVVERCQFSGTSAKGFVYMSDLVGLEERDCVFVNTGATSLKCYNIASGDPATLYNPTIKGMGLVQFINSGVNVHFYINPEKLNDLCNQVTYHTIYLENEYFVELTAIDSNNLYNNIIAVDAGIIKLRGNGVFTLINKNHSSHIIDNGTGSLVLKNGANQYTKDEWTAKMFRVINNVAYEI